MSTTKGRLDFQPPPLLSIDVRRGLDGIIMIMSTVSLYDILARGIRTHPDNRGDLPAFGKDLARAAVNDWQRLRDYERKFAPPPDSDPAVVEEWDRSIWELHRDWANEAIKLLIRLRPLATTLTPDLDELEDAYGRTQARLSVTPAELTRARADARAGRTIPVQVLRDELRARLHA
jgi:hypothetical protein